jgi:myo-inositol-1(or 4)-monophosphatase
MENKAIAIALKAGEILRSFFGHLSFVRQKSTYWDLVTEADLASEAYILKSIKDEFPDHTILSEEAGLIQHQGSTHQWFIDPLDGTTNFTHQYPMFAVSMGLVINQVPELGIVYNPISGELFVASKGRGATLNGKAIHVSKVDTLERSLLGTGFAYDRKETSENNYAEFCHITNMSQGVRRGGSAALDLAFVAAGRLDGYWERGLKPWDTAAGILLVQEAGGLCTSYEGRSIDLASGRILATNGITHPLLINELTTVANNRSKEKI